MRRVDLKELVTDPDVADADVAELDIRIRLEAPPVPEAFQNLRRLLNFDLLTGDAVMALVGQAPIDPFGVYAALRMAIGPEGWIFSAIDFTVFHALRRDEDGAVGAAMRLDLLSDDVVLLRREGNSLVAVGECSGEKMAAAGETGFNELLSALAALVDQAQPVH